MKKWILITALILLIPILLAGVYFGLLHFADIDLLDRSGWLIDEQTGDKFYLDYYGQKMMGWSDLDEGRFFFDPDRHGAMVTGWAVVDGKNFYFEESGELVVGWKTLGEDKYYLNATGRDETGWKTVDGLRYYLDEFGRVHKGWLDLSDGEYYLDENGNPLVSWADIDNLRFCFDESGKMITGWYRDEAFCYYLTAQGMYTGWMDSAEARYFFDESGRMQTGWVDSTDGRYYFDDSGHMLTGWIGVEGKKYFLNEEGVMQTGWFEWEGNTYYFKDSGEAAVGKLVIDKKTYYFASTGKYVILVNRWNPVPQGYKPNLVSIEGFKVSADCKDALQKMLNDCRAAGYKCEINTAYRNIAYQTMLWNARYNDYIDQGLSASRAFDLTARRVLPPGTSEHHLGYAVDIVGSERMYQWLEEHAPNYGFILRYPEDKIDETGIIYEPWHFRYLGIELAQELDSLDMTLEAYMEMLTASAQ
jgi:glucan-binding YG repeat protein